MHGLICDICGDNLLVDSDVRYLVKIEVLAAYDPLEITPQDLERDLEAEMAKLLADLQARDPDEIEDTVYRRLSYDLCPPCQRRYLADPLLGHRRGAAAEE